MYQVEKRGRKRLRELSGATDGGGPEDVRAASAEDIQAASPEGPDETMRAAEDGYHADLVHLLRQPFMWQNMGLPGPPTRIQHASLEEQLSTWRAAGQQAV